MGRVNRAVYLWVFLPLLVQVHGQSESMPDSTSSAVDTNTTTSLPAVSITDDNQTNVTNTTISNTTMPIINTTHPTPTITTENTITFTTITENPTTITNSTEFSPTSTIDSSTKISTSSETTVKPASSTTTTPTTPPPTTEPPTTPPPTTEPPTTTPTVTSRPAPQSDTPIGLIIGLLIVGTLIVAFLAFVTYRYFKTGSFKKTFIFKDPSEYQPEAKPSSTKQPRPVEEDVSSYPRSMPIKITELPDKYIELCANSCLPLRRQYMMLSRLSPKHPQTAARITENTYKNRYTDILPFDHNRVLLDKLEDDELSDYVNASFVPGYKFKGEYITCQGPTEASVNDHWRMIWEKNIRVIVMVTKCEEGEFLKREKCIQYWPDRDGAPHQYGPISVTFLSSEKHCRDNFKIRKLDVRNGTDTRIVYHFQYLRWPDKQNPEDPEGLLEYREQIRDAMMQFEDGPIVVHCSAGVGRSGTYIALDILLQHMDDHDTVDIFALILKLRDHRVLMVQTEGQYMFIHQCLLLNLDNKRKQEVETGHIYNNLPEDDYNPYENIPMAKKGPDSGRKSIFSSGSGRKRKSKVVASKYTDLHEENAVKDAKKPPPIPLKTKSVKTSDTGHNNEAMTSSEGFVLENGNAYNAAKTEATIETNLSESSSKGDNPKPISEDAIVLIEDS